MSATRHPTPLTDVRCILIGGRSNAGKSSVAACLAGRLGWTTISTDKLGRHPGRPWGVVPDHVVAHYTELDDAAILDAVLVHQRNMWPKIEALVREHASRDGAGMVLEGSAIMPQQTASLGLPTVAAIWLTGEDALFRQRIETESADAGPAAKHLVDRFIERNERLDAVLRAEAQKFGLPLLDVGRQTIEAVADACFAGMKRLG